VNVSDPTLPVVMDKEWVLGMPDSVAVHGNNVYLGAGLFGGTYISGVTDNIGLDTWNMETNERTIVIDDPWDQGMPDASGYIIAYVDSQAADEYWFTNNRGQVKIIDRETLVVRTITPLVGRYYSIGIWNRWLAFNPTSYWGDVIVLCDLLEGGFIDADGHVCPEGTCPDMDASIDGGADGGK
jgi:hypothetical protein